MSRLLLFVIILVVIVVGGMFVLAGRAREKPPVHVEKVVPLENLAK